jgi:uncharacterized protein (TIGR02996 family)
MHPEEDSLLRAVAAAPDDDAVRLVYADWLDEHGQPERAEFIRVQIERGRLPEDDDRQAELAARERDPNYHRRFRWTAVWPRCVNGYHYVRGFPDRVGYPSRPYRDWRLSPEDLREMEGAMERLPIRAFEAPLLGCRGTRFRWSDRPFFPPPGAGGLEALAGWPALRRLTALEVGSATSGEETLGDFTPGLEALAASPYAEGLTRLQVSTRCYEATALRAVAVSPRLPRLEDLDLSDGFADITAAALSRLPGTPLAQRLRKLNCAWVPLAGELVRALLDAAPLSALSVGAGDEDGEGGLGPVLGAPGLGRLRLLGITGEESGLLTDDLDGRVRRRAVPGLVELLRSPLLGGLEKLSLAGVELGDAGARALAEAPLARGLIDLKLDLCGLSGAGLRALRPLLAEGRLRRLSLSHNYLSDADAAELASWPELGRLHELSLGYFNDVTDEGKEAIRASPHRHRWLCLD